LKSLTRRVTVMIICLTSTLWLIATQAQGAKKNRLVDHVPCLSQNPLRTAFFGDTHVHTKFSLDASTQDTRTTPAQAYQFAKGQPIGVQPWTADGKALRSLQLERPLDFAMVTDHAELIGEVNVCSTQGMKGFDSWQCSLYRWWPRGAFFLFNSASSTNAERLGFCGEDGALCREAALNPWQEMQQAAEQAYDHSENCEFTSFVAYEWTGGTDIANLHRNIIFRNDQVPRLPISFIETPTAQKLWKQLDKECIDAGTGCDAIVIPHNSNLSTGKIFPKTRDDGSPLTADSARQTSRLETLVEVMQHKGSSECYFGPAQIAGITEDELCAFEQLPYNKFSGQYASWLAQPPTADGGFLREVLRDGLRETARIGVNPYKWGFIGSTDTHLGAPGAVSEMNFLGHGGAGKPAGDATPAGLPDNLEYNPGGLAVLYAEQNTRDSLFSAMRRREAYGTSGPRIGVRFFGGWNYSKSMCESSDFVTQGYTNGVPMGGDLPKYSQGQSPFFAVRAIKDPGTDHSAGMQLQRVQIIKGWVDSEGQSREQVYEVAGSANNGAKVDLGSCQVSGKGFDQLCQVWKDPDFNADHHAYYYARVVENPTCRWSQFICSANKVDCGDSTTITDGLEGCCSAQHRPTIQERAWTSPIWYTPQ
jgi:Protein of unknown function (DUF3604)